jgi:acetyl esterase/lipase
MRPDLTHAGSHDALIGRSADATMIDHYSVERRVGADTPPIFLVHSADDKTVPVQNSLLMYQAMLAAKRGAAMHLFETGGHGFGVNLPPSEPAHDWPDLLFRFAAAHGVAR